MKGRELEFYENQPVADEDVQELMNDEIDHSPKAPHELEERLLEHNSTSPADSGGDIDAEWEDANDSGAEAVFGHNPTPDQSDVEDNAHAMGINFEDDEPLDFEKKMADRDKNRYEMKEPPKGRNSSI
jgi:hypothetical protein